MTNIGAIITIAIDAQGSVSSLLAISCIELGIIFKKLRIRYRKRGESSELPQLQGDHESNSKRTKKQQHEE